MAFFFERLESSDMTKPTDTVLLCRGIYQLHPDWSAETKKVINNIDDA